MNSFSKQLDAIQLAEAKLQAKKFRTLEKALRSDSPEDMVKATQVFQNQIKNKVEQNNKSFYIDPLEFNSNLGYKDKPFSLSYTTLKRMSKTPIINSIIKTRKNQIADFAEPQENKYSTGFIIRKKNKSGVEQEMSKQDKKIAFSIQDFLMKGGNVNQWGHDDFDTFIRKIIEDSLVYDQMTFECVRNRRGQLESFMATDASTFRMAESHFDKDYQNAFFNQRGSGSYYNNQSDFGPKVHGYRPSYVQVYQSTKVNEFYPWELCFGIRNPSTSIHANGYGSSELEELINVVTSLLWGDEYNRRFFSQGSAPKGLLRVKGGGNEAALQQFKQQWQSMITGVMQAWKTPVVEADVEWIDLQKNNRDMEYSSWMEYLIKLACAIFSIDPSEIGWDISRSSGSDSMFQGSQAERMKHSKDKGLYPLLKFLQRKINTFIVEQIHPEFELVFAGLNGMTIEEELEMDIKKTNSFQMINETRDKYDMEPLEFGDIPSNSIYLQAKNSAQMAAQQQGMMGGGEEGEEDNPFDEYEDEEGGYNPFDEYEDEEGGYNPFDDYEDEDFDEAGGEEEETEKGDDMKDIFVKAFDNFLKQEEI